MEDKTTLSDNSKLIYEHAEESVKKINKSIDIVTTKLMTSFGFSGIFLKFAADMPSSGYLFSLKVCVAAFLLLAICFCGCGLYPKAAGDSLTTRYLREDLYYYPDEEIRRRVIDQKLKSIDELKEVAEFRIAYLNNAILSLMLAAVAFGASIIVEAIP